VVPLDSSTRHQLGAESIKGGVVVSVVDPDGKVADKLNVGDIIVELDQHYIASITDFKKAVKNLKKGDDLLIRIFRHGAWLYKVVRL
jgi:S1-C subfamily serine protease